MKTPELSHAEKLLAVALGHLREDASKATNVARATWATVSFHTGDGRHDTAVVRLDQDEFRQAKARFLDRLNKRIHQQATALAGGLVSCRYCGKGFLVQDTTTRALACPACKPEDGDVE